MQHPVHESSLDYQVKAKQPRIGTVVQQYCNFVGSRTTRPKVKECIRSGEQEATLLTKTPMSQSINPVPDWGYVISLTIWTSCTIPILGRRRRKLSMDHVHRTNFSVNCAEWSLIELLNYKSRLGVTELQ